MCWTHREQARSHRVGGCTQYLRATEIMVGASLLAMVECQSTSILNVLDSSRASSLPQGWWVYAISASNRNHGGSELARDGGVSVDIYFECAGLIASKLAPTGLVGVRNICEQPKSWWE